MTTPFELDLGKAFSDGTIDLTEQITKAAGRILRTVKVTADDGTQTLEDRLHVIKSLADYTEHFTANTRTQEGRDSVVTRKPLMLGTGTSDDAADNGLTKDQCIHIIDLASKMGTDVDGLLSILSELFKNFPAAGTGQYRGRGAAMRQIANAADGYKVEDNGKLAIATTLDNVREELRLEKSATKATKPSTAELNTARNEERAKVYNEIAPAVSKATIKGYKFDPDDVTETPTRDAFMKIVNK
jgi:hypothetical protein